MATLVEHGFDISGATAARPTSPDIGCRFYDTTLGVHLVWDGTEWRYSGQAASGGAVNGATVSRVESSGLYKTVLTLASTPVAVVSVTTGNGVGGTKVFDFPQGIIRFLGCTAALSLSIATAKQADFTDSTPEGDVGIGTVAPANADALGTDATDDDFGTAAAFAMTAYADTLVEIGSEATANFDGRTTPIDVYVNMLVDAADIDDGVTTEVLVSGTITLHWANLGDT